MSDNPLDELTSMSSDESLQNSEQQMEAPSQPNAAATKTADRDEETAAATRPQRLVTERVSEPSDTTKAAEPRQQLEPEVAEAQPTEVEKPQQSKAPRIPSKDPETAKQAARVPTKKPGMQTEVVSRDKPPVPPRAGNGFKWLVLAGVLLILGLLLVVGYLVWQLQQQEQQVRGPQPLSTPTSQVTPAVTVQPTATPASEPQAVAGWQEYQSDEWGVVFSHPPGLQPVECETGVKLLEATASAAEVDACESPPFGPMQMEVLADPLGLADRHDEANFTILTDVIAVGGETGEYLMVQKTGEAPGPEYQEFVTVEQGERFYQFWLRTDEMMDEFEELLGSVRFDL